MSPQDKIIHVANKLGLSSLKAMQGSTGAVYDVDSEASGTIFAQAARHQNPGITNVTENQFEVNEALLVENIGFYVSNFEEFNVSNFQTFYGSNAVIVFDLVIGNKRVMKDTPVFAAGSPYTFSDVAISDSGAASTFRPRHQVFLEGAGILIPPQVQWYVSYTIYNVVTGDIIPVGDEKIGCYLFGTKVLLNFNTSI